MSARRMRMWRLEQIRMVIKQEKSDETKICEALELYKSSLPVNAFYVRGKNLGPILVI